MADVVLHRLDRKHILLGGYTVLEVLRVRAEPRDAFSAPRAALAILPKDPLYQRCYVCGRPDDHVTLGIHGPFRVELIVPDAFVDASAEELRQLLRTRVAEFAGTRPPAPERLAAMESCLDEVLVKDRDVFILGLDPKARGLQHEWGGVQQMFSEGFVVDRAAGEAWVLVLIED